MEDGQISRIFEPDWGPILGPILTHFGAIFEGHFDPQLSHFLDLYNEG